MGWLPSFTTPALFPTQVLLHVVHHAVDPLGLELLKTAAGFPTVVRVAASLRDSHMVKDRAWGGSS